MGRGTELSKLLSWLSHRRRREENYKNLEIYVSKTENKGNLCPVPSRTMNICKISGFFESQHTWENSRPSKWSEKPKTELLGLIEGWMHIQCQTVHYSTALKKQIAWPAELTIDTSSVTEKVETRKTQPLLPVWNDPNQWEQGGLQLARMVWWQRLTQHIALLNAWTSQSLCLLPSKSLLPWT